MTISYRLARRFAEAVSGPPYDGNGTPEQYRWKISEHELNSRQDAVAAALAPHGFRRNTSRSDTWTRLESGHHVVVRLTPETNHWHAFAYHPGDPHGLQTWMSLGRHDEHVPDQLMREMRHPETMRSLQGQWRRAAENGDPTGEEYGQRRVHPERFVAGDVFGHYVNDDEYD